MVLIAKRWTGSAPKPPKAKFFDLVNQISEAEWIWVGDTTTNHNTREDIERYRYGYYDHPVCKSKLVHRIMCFEIWGIELDQRFHVFPLDENHLNISPINLCIRDTITRQEWTAEDFFSSLTEAAE